MWNDPAIGIDWKGIAPDIEPLLSEKDTRQEKFCTDRLYFDLNSKWIGGQNIGLTLAKVLEKTL